MAKHKKFADLNGSFADVLEEDQFYVAIFFADGRKSKLERLVRDCL